MVSTKEKRKNVGTKLYPTMRRSSTSLNEPKPNYDLSPTRMSTSRTVRSYTNCSTGIIPSSLILETGWSASISSTPTSATLPKSRCAAFESGLVMSPYFTEKTTWGYI